jgi:adenine specific DNA methylase Mod
MFPTTQPINIYNTMSRNPFETEYKTESEKWKNKTHLNWNTN